MPKYQIVDTQSFGSKRWGIEKVTPGESPVSLSFLGSLAEVQEEVIRLNRVGEPKETSAMAKTPKRPRDANQLAKHIVDLATGVVSEDQPEQLGTEHRASRHHPSTRRSGRTAGLE